MNNYSEMKKLKDVHELMLVEFHLGGETFGILSTMSVKFLSPKQSQNSRLPPVH